MAAISSLNEDFEGGSIGSTVTTGNTIFDNISAGATVTFHSDAYQGTRSMNIAATAQNASLRADYPGSTTLWIGFYLKIVAAPATLTAVSNWYQGATKIGDLRIDSTGAISIRDSSTTQWTSPAPLALGSWHRIAVKVVPGSTTGHRVKVYSGTNLDGATPSQDSGNLTATLGGTTAIDIVRLGLISAETATIRFDRLRADDATEPTGLAGGVGTVVANAGADQVNVPPYTTVNLAGSASGGTSPYTYAWAQTAGSPTVTLSGSGANRTFVAPGTLNGTTLTFRITATDSASISGTDTVDIYVNLHNEFTRTSGGQWIPYNPRNRQGGAWVS